MTMPIVEKALPIGIDRTFYLTDFSTHNTLILRSLKDGARREQIDIAFRPISALKLSQTLEFLAVRYPDEAELDAVTRDVGPRAMSFRGQKVFMVEGGHAVGYIVAMSMYMAVGSLPGVHRSPLLPDMDHFPDPGSSVPRFRFS